MQPVNKQNKVISKTPINYDANKKLLFDQAIKFNNNKIINDSLAPRESTNVIIRPAINRIPTHKYTNIPFKNAGLPQTAYKVVNNAIEGKSNFAVVDKDVDSIYYFNKNKELLQREPVITGSDPGIESKELSMKSFFEKFNTTNHDDYFAYLKNNKFRVTPEGVFKIGEVRENVAENPDIKGNFFNKYIRLDNRERYNTILNNRLRDYGSQQKILTLVDRNGVGMNNAIHGTDNKEREAAFNLQNKVIDNKLISTNRKLSNGCINVNDKSCVFDLLKKDDKVIVSSKNDYNTQYNLNSPINYSKHNTLIKNEKNDIYNTLIKNGVQKSQITDDAINFITSVGEKETKFMRSPFARLEDFLPRFLAKTQGVFQINPETFKEYLPKDYDDSYDNQVMAVKNFYDKNLNEAVNTKYIESKGPNKGQLVSPQKGLYDKYNTGSFSTSSDASSKFEELSKKVQNIK